MTANVVDSLGEASPAKVALPVVPKSRSYSESVGKTVLLCATSAYSASPRWNSTQKQTHRGDAEYAEVAQSFLSGRLYSGVRHTHRPPANDQMTNEK